MPNDRVVTGAPPLRGKPKPPREPKTPGAVAMLRKAIAWRALLDSGQVANQAEIARREGVTRARVTQVMGLLRLSPAIQQQILTLSGAIGRPAITEPALRPIARLPQGSDQLHAFQELLAGSRMQGWPNLPIIEFVGRIPSLTERQGAQVAVRPDRA